MFVAGRRSTWASEPTRGSLLIQLTRFDRIAQLEVCMVTHVEPTFGNLNAIFPMQGGRAHRQQ